MVCLQWFLCVGDSDGRVVVVAFGGGEVELVVLTVQSKVLEGGIIG